MKLKLLLLLLPVILIAGCGIGEKDNTKKYYTHCDDSWICDSNWEYIMNKNYCNFMISVWNEDNQCNNICE